ncbi:MAG: ribosome maturation factor RimP, partial [Candidatus Acidiferrales bacterium]
VSVKEFFERMNLEKVREAAERVARSLGLEIFDIEWKIGKQRLLRVYIDRLPGPLNPEGAGITHSDCEQVSQQLSVILDVEDIVPGPAYILEVSSPGLDRKLIRAEDYQRFAGRLARIWTNEPVEGQSYFEGRLAGFADGAVKILVRDHELSVPFAGIRKANLVVEL